MSIPFDDTLREDLRVRLAGFPRREHPLEERRAAAVALVVVPGGAEPEEIAEDGTSPTGDIATVLLTLRSQDLRRHSGQFALPGGRLDAGETTAEAALRELDEELGLALDAERVLGRLDDYITRSGFVITPVVVWGERAILRPDPGEVDRVFRIPLTTLADPSTVEVFDGDEDDDPLLTLFLFGYNVFAPTAAILHQFAELAVHGRITRVARYGQPRFAWR